MAKPFSCFGLIRYRVIRFWFYTMHMRMPFCFFTNLVFYYKVDNTTSVAEP